MLLRLVALGAAGYAGYKYLMMQGQRETYPPSPGEYPSGKEPQAAESPDPEPEVALAGGPLSSEATLVHKDEAFPPT